MSRVPSPVVVNASPVIVLAKAGFLDLLRLAGDPVQVPRAVVQEVQQGGANDPAAQALAQTAWLTPVDPGPAPAPLQAFGLGPGEEAVLAWALANPGTEALIDDQAARRCAKALGIPHRGCLGLVILARQQGVLPAARPVLEQLRQAGLRLSNRVLSLALALVGE
jgi:predicted nucleic acid-binding protein